MSPEWERPSSPERETEGPAAKAVTLEVTRWYKRAAVACAPFLFPETRFRTPWTGDDLPLAVAAARLWHEENPCPDAGLDHHVTALLDGYAELANSTVSRMMEIREDIAAHAEVLDRRRGPRNHMLAAS